MRNEPLIKHGLRRFELRLWEVREGALSIRTYAAKKLAIEMPFRLSKQAHLDS
jgi:hypothetical protein